MALHGTTRHYMALHGTTWHYIALHRTTSHCTLETLETLETLGTLGTLGSCLAFGFSSGLVTDVTLPKDAKSVLVFWRASLNRSEQCDAE